MSLFSVHWVLATTPRSPFLSRRTYAYTMSPLGTSGETAYLMMGMLPPSSPRVSFVSGRRARNSASPADAAAAFAAKKAKARVEALILKRDSAVRSLREMLPRPTSALAARRATLKFLNSSSVAFLRKASSESHCSDALGSGVGVGIG